MSKKISPLLFRKNFNFTNSKWVEKKNYKINVLINHLINTFIIKWFKKNNLISFSHFYKVKSLKQTTIVIETFILFLHLSENTPQILLTQQKFFKNLLYQHIKKKINLQNFKLKVNFITKTPKLVFYNLIEILENQIKKNVRIKLIFETFFTFCETTEIILGSKLELSGRLDGIEKAQKIFKIQGSLKLQTISSKIIYIQKNILTRDGIIGLKMWTCIK